MPQRQRTRIFKDRKIRDELVVPLVCELSNNAAFGQPGQKEYEDIMRLEAELTALDVPHDWVRLIDDKEHRRHWEIWLKSNTDTHIF